VTCEPVVGTKLSITAAAFLTESSPCANAMAPIATGRRWAREGFATIFSPEGNWVTSCAALSDPCAHAAEARGDHEDSGERKGRAVGAGADVCLNSHSASMQAEFTAAPS
jgi:hypothetical protein